MCKLVADHDTSLIVSGNSLGKSFWIAGIVLWYLFTRPNSIILTSAPTQTSLSSVFWRYIRDAFNNSMHPLGGKITASPYEMLKLDENWLALGISTTKTEKLSGFHGKSVMACLDEASGISSEVWSAIDSLAADRIIAVGNPLRCDNQFYQLVQKAQMPGSMMGFMRISSMESPDINKWNSETGLASQKWLATNREKYGEASLWWLSHVLAEFPEESSASLFRKEWLDACVNAEHIPSGFTRIAVDYAEGGGKGDEAVIGVRDDGGLYELEGSNQWKPEELSRRVAAYARQYKVDPSRISWDAGGTGSSFGEFLQGQGLTGCRAYKGSFGASRDAVGTNYRTCAAWALARRLDPSREKLEEVPVLERTGPRILWTNQQPQLRRTKDATFAIPEHLMQKLRHELQSLRYEQTATDKIHLENAEDYRDRLGRSPNYSDCLIQSFYWS
ncbi:terminase large subunit domain-containing protein [Tundrisphaera sp. TA3]|uniref:terminase large subunit domain-containing protein n=1 Tax=Tundrisphaera sp. TA3 TaxID=3435775 RepID=UPI003EBE94D6